MTKETRLLRSPLVRLDRFGNLPERGQDVAAAADRAIRQRLQQALRGFERLQY